MFRGYGKMGFREFPNRMFESGPNEYGRYGAQYDWEAGYGITLNGTTVSAWKDKIQGVTFIQNTVGNQPLIANAVINGYDAVYANNTIKRMDSLTPIILGNDYWLAWVFLDSNAGGIIGPHNTGASGNIQPTRPLLGNSSSIYIGAFCTSKIDTNTGFNGRYVLAGANSSWYIVIFTKTQIWVNGVSEPIVGLVNYPSIITYDRIFGSIINTSNNTTGYLARLIIGNQDLSDSSIIGLSDSLNSKYLIY